MFSGKIIGQPELLFLTSICINVQTMTKISNGNRTEWSPIRSVIIRVITKSDDRAAIVLFITSMITDRIGRHEVLLAINHKSYNFREKKNSQVMKERENLH